MSTRSSRSSAAAPTSWEDAARKAVDTASAHLEDLRVAEVVKLDMKIQDNKVVAYRARLQLSFRYHAGEGV